MNPRQELIKKRHVTMKRLLQFDGIPEEDSPEYLEFKRLFYELQRIDHQINDELEFLQQDDEDTSPSRKLFSDHNPQSLI